LLSEIFDEYWCDIDYDYLRILITYLQFNVRSLPDFLLLIMLFLEILSMQNKLDNRQLVTAWLLVKCGMRKVSCGMQSVQS